jgi:hypothetical protein
MPHREPEDYELLTTLWYATREDGKPNSQAVLYNTVPVASDAYDNIRSLYSDPENPLGFGPLGNDYTISYKGVRTSVGNENSAITFPSFKETFIINVPAGSIEGGAVYYDKGSGTDTTVDENVFTVTGGSGVFQGAEIAIISYDNSGDKFGEPSSRRIEVFKLKDHSPLPPLPPVPEEIPNLNGEWEYAITVFRRNNQFEVPDLNKLISVKTVGKIVQKGQFLSLELSTDDLRPVPGYLLGVLNYSQNAWRLTFSDFDDNGVFNFIPNKYGPSGEILEFNGYYTESGFAGQSPTQLQTVGLPTLRKINLQ